MNTYDLLLLPYTRTHDLPSGLLTYLIGDLADEYPEQCEGVELRCYAHLPADAMSKGGREVSALYVDGAPAALVLRRGKYSSDWCVRVVDPAAMRQLQLRLLRQCPLAEADDPDLSECLEPGDYEALSKPVPR